MVWRLLFAGIMLLCGLYISRGQDISPDYFVEAVINNEAPFVGQQITYRFTFYDATNQPNPLYQTPDFEGFWRIDKAPQEQRIQQINGRQYRVTIIETGLFPARTGTLIIPPGKVILPETVFQIEQELISKPITIQVQPLPPGIPEGFTGAVGQFEIMATLSSQAATVGEPFTLTLTITGTGNVDQLPAPILSLPTVWRAYNNTTEYNFTEINGEIVGSRSYTFQIVSSEAGNYILPPLTFPFLDTENMMFRNLSTSPVEVTVFPAQNLTETTLPNTSSTSIRPISVSSHSEGTLSNLLLWALWLFPPFALGGFRFRRWGRQQIAHRQTKTIQSAALTNALNKVITAEKAQTSQKHQLIKEAITISLETSAHLTSMSPQDIKTLARIRDWLEESRYMPTGETVDIQAVIQQVRTILTSHKKQQEK